MKAGFIIEITETKDYEEVDLHIYQRLIDKLIYLAYGIRPDIFFVVRQLSRHNVDSRKGHLEVAKRIVRYFCGTMEMSLMYGRKLNNQMLRNPLLIGLIRFADSSFTGDPKDRKSVISYYFFLNGAVVSWYSKKQRTVLTLTTKAKYIALSHIIREVV